MSRLSIRKMSEVLRQFELPNNRDISRSLNINPSTVSNYLRRAKAARLIWPFPKGVTEQSLYNILFLPVKTQETKRQCPDWDPVHHELHKKGMTL